MDSTPYDATVLFVLVVGLTGGIGSGKSTVAELLAAHGAVIVDADVIAREVVEPGTVAFQAIRARFGRSVVGPDGRIDRKELASIVFADDDALDDLNGIVHPFVREEIQKRIEETRPSDEVLILVIPLLLESGHYQVDALVVVDLDEDSAVERVRAQRNLTEKQVRARMASQISREQRRAAADFIIENGGSPEDLRNQVDQAWKWISEKL